MKYEIKLQNLNGVEEHRVIEKMVEKLKYSYNRYTSEEMTKILNFYGQEYLTKLSDIAKRNKEFSIIDLAKILYEWKYITIYKNICYARRPYTYNYIIPILKNGFLIGFDEELVLPKQVEDKLQAFCNQKLKNKENKLN